MMFVHHMDSSLGRITMSSDGESLTGLVFEEERHPQDRSGAVEQAVPVLLDTERQILEYLGGWRKSFDLPIRAQGTEFQQRVWEKLCEIPFGETISYLQLALRLGNEKAVRAVGLANGKNPISIVVPCHRVIGADGKLVGYGGGVWRKEKLLELEGLRSGKLF